MDSRRVILTLVALLATLALLAAPSAQAVVIIDAYGNVSQPQGQVLSSGRNGDSGSSTGGNSGTSGGSNDDTDDAQPTTTPRTSPRPDLDGDVDDADEDMDDADETGIRTEIRQGIKSRTEIRLDENTRIRTRVEDGRTRTEVIQGGVKIRIEREGDRFRIKAETEGIEGAAAEEEELEDELLVIDERADKGQIRVRALADRALIERAQVQALTQLPLSIDLATNTLTVTTPAGERTLTVLPDQAVQNMLAANVIDRLGGEALTQLVLKEGLTTFGQVIAMAERNGVPIYEIQGFKDQRLLGFLPVQTQVTVIVSAETGEVVDTQQPLLDRLIAILSTSV